jgi:hypothetical protein
MWLINLLLAVHWTAHAGAPPKLLGMPAKGPVFDRPSRENPRVFDLGLGVTEEEKKSSAWTTIRFQWGSFLETAALTKDLDADAPEDPSFRSETRKEGAPGGQAFSRLQYWVKKLAERYLERTSIWESSSSLPVEIEFLGALERHGRVPQRTGGALSVLFVASGEAELELPDPRGSVPPFDSVAREGLSAGMVALFPQYIRGAVEEVEESTIYAFSASLPGVDMLEPEVWDSALTYRSPVNIDRLGKDTFWNGYDESRDHRRRAALEKYRSWEL